MCLTNLKKLKEKEIVCYKAVRKVGNSYYGLYTFELLKRGVFNKARIVDKDDALSKKICKVLGISRRGHNFISNIKPGFGCFSTRRELDRYIENCSYLHPLPYIRSIKVKIRRDLYSGEIKQGAWREGRDAIQGSELKILEEI